MKKLVVAGLCLLLMVGAVQAYGAGLTGRNVLSGAASWVSVSGEDVSATLLAASYARFMSENLELKADVIFARGELGGDDLNAWVLAPAVAWNFTPATPSAIVPYVGAGFTFAGVDTPGDDDTSFNFEAFAGARFFIGGDYTTSDKAVFFEYRYAPMDIFGSDANLNMLWGGVCMLL